MPLGNVPRVSNQKKTVFYLLGLLTLVAGLAQVLRESPQQSFSGELVSVNNIRWGVPIEEESEKLVAMGLVEAQERKDRQVWKGPNVTVKVYGGKIYSVRGDRLTIGGVDVLWKGQSASDAPRNLSSAFKKLVPDEWGSLYGIAIAETGELYVIDCLILEGKFAEFSAERLQLPAAGKAAGIPPALYD